MAAGRPAKSQKRSALGKRLLEARQQAGLSQAQVAAKMKLPQQTYAGWERTTSAIKPEHIAQLAVILGVPVEFLVGQEPPKERKGGPVGRARRAFEQVSKLPRTQQQHILKVVEAFVESAAG